MKLPLKKSQGVVMPNWHPDFRNASALPDLKLIRTSFFVNVLFVTVALAAALFIAHREYTAMNIQAEIDAAEQRMAAAGPRNNALLALNRDFVEASMKVTEAAEFADAQLVASELILALGHSLPTYMDLTAVSLENNQLVLRGTIRGASEMASDRLSEYLDILRQDPVAGKAFPEVSINSFLRDPRSQSMSFEILLKPKAPAANPAKP